MKLFLKIGQSKYYVLYIFQVQIKVIQCHVFCPVSKHIKQYKDSLLYFR